MVKNKIRKIIFITGLCFISLSQNPEAVFMDFGASQIFPQPIKPENLILRNQRDTIDFIKEIGEATHRGLEAMIDEATGWPVNSAVISSEGKIIAGFKSVSVAAVGLRILSLIGARDREIIDDRELNNQLRNIVETLEKKVEKWNGFYYQWYALDERSNKGYLKRKPMGDIPDNFIPSLDNAILSASLMVAVRAVNDIELKKRFESLLGQQNYAAFYNQESGLMRIGIEVNPVTGVIEKLWDDYKHFYTEINLLTLIAVAKGDVPRSVWDNLSRDVVEYLTQTATKLSFYRSWGGSIYEGLFSDLFLNYNQNAPKSLAASSRNLILAQQDFAFKNGYSFWGWSPAANDPNKYPDGGYYNWWGISEFGNGGAKGTEATAPYSSFLALRFAPDEAIANLKRIHEISGSFSPDFGFVDTIYLDQTPYRVLLSWDQLMSDITYHNYISELGGIPGIDYYFWSYIDDLGEIGRKLLKEEDKKYQF